MVEYRRRKRLNHRTRRPKVNKRTLPKLETKFNPKNIKIDFAGGDISSDGGLLLVKKIDDRLNFMNNINRLVEDPRDPQRITHTQKQLFSQRIYQIIAGYEDCDDADWLKNDPVFKLIAEKDNWDEPLGSQPTLSRLENRITRGQISRLKRELVEQYIRAVRPGDDRPIILDCDSTDDPTHGDQQLTLFSGLFDQRCYHPLLVFDFDSQTIVAAHLRPGNQHPARNADRILRPVVRRLKERYPRRQIIIRGDCSFGSLRMADFCLIENCHYIFAVGNTSNRFDKHTEPFLIAAQEQFDKTQEEAVVTFSFEYSSRAWKTPVNIIAQIKVDAQGSVAKFLLTDLPGTSEELFKLYHQRGQAENYIKELKLGFKADRLSCHDFKANFFRLLLHCFAYQLTNFFKRFLANITRSGSQQIDTLRLTFLKIGAVVYNRCRWSRIHLSSSWPLRDSFITLAHQLGFT